MKGKIEKETRVEKPDIQVRRHRAEVENFGRRPKNFQLKKIQSTPGIETNSYSSVGEHVTSTPPPLPKLWLRIISSDMVNHELHATYLSCSLKNRAAVPVLRIQ